MPCVCDYTAPQVYLAKQVKARKSHVCEECRNTIRAGDAYERVSGLWEGQWETFRTCLGCVSLRQYTEGYVPCVCWQHGNMVEDCLETLQEYAHELPGMLFGAYRLIVKNKLNRRNTCKTKNT